MGRCFTMIAAARTALCRNFRNEQESCHSFGAAVPSPAINKNAVEVTRDSSGEGGKELDPLNKTKQAAILFLRDWLFPMEVRAIRILVEKHGHQHWVWHLHDEEIAELYPQEKKYAVLLSPHFGFGMQVRNALRRAGFGEQEFGVRSLDDVYVDLLEAAVQESHGPGPNCAGVKTPTN